MGISDYLEKIIQSIDSIPPFPDVVMRVLEIAEDPDSSAGDIVDVIQYDQAVTANCLRLCNSSYFALREKVQSIRQAVVLLGTGNLVKIVIADCCRLSAFSKGQSGYGLGPGELWHHSMATALISQVLAKKLGHSDTHELFTAALLHDIGKLIIDQFIADNFEAMFKVMQDEGFGMVETEKAHFGIDHAELGARIAASWGFPEPLVTAIHNHHRLPKVSGSVDMASLTALSNLFTHVSCDYPTRFRHEHISCGVDRQVLGAFGLSEADMDAVNEEAAVEIKKAEELLRFPSL